MAKYLYNGVELPALPEWDKTTYPYAVLWVDYRTSSGELWNIYVWAFDHPVYYDPSTYKLSTTAGAKYYANRRLSNVSVGMSNEWEVYGEGITEYGAIATLDPDATYTHALVWSNHDVYDLDGSVYLPASDPVPVTPTPADLYVKKGGKVYKVKGGSAQNIMTFDSVDEMNAASAPDGTIALVPSEGGNGLPVVELTTVLTAEPATLTDAENAALTAAAETGLPAMIKMTEVVTDGEGEGAVVDEISAAVVAAYGGMTGMKTYVATLGAATYQFMTTDGSTWLGIKES